MKLTRRTILITGGASGIGFALAEQLLQQQNRVIICGRNQDKLSRAQQQLPALETIQCDINRADDLTDLQSRLTRNFPQLDTLINNAGIQQQLDLTHNKSLDQAVMHEIHTNLVSQINITHCLYPLLTSNSNPAILFVSSALAMVPKVQAPIYSASKAGLHSYVQSLRHQVKNDGIQVVEVFPDVIDTPMTGHRVSEKKMNANVFAAEVLKKLQANPAEIFTGRTRLLTVLNRCFPGLALKVINRA